MSHPNNTEDELDNYDIVLEAMHINATERLDPYVETEDTVSRYAMIVKVFSIF